MRQRKAAWHSVFAVLLASPVYAGMEMVELTGYCDGEGRKEEIGVTAWLQKKLPYGTPQGLVTSARVLRRMSFIRRFYC